MLRVLTILLCGFLSANLSAANFQALLIGIDYRQVAHVNPLSGAINDARDWYQLLTQQMGVQPDAITLLLEQQATREAILQALRDLKHKTQPGDSIFIQFSGHGASLADPYQQQMYDPLKQDDQSGQQLAEAFVPYNVLIDSDSQRIENLIFDTELQILLQQLPDREVTLFLDLCHSGGVTKTPFANHHRSRHLDLSKLQHYTVLPANNIPTLSATAGRSLVKSKSSPDWQPSYRYFAASHYFQKAYEYPLQQGHNGALTYPVLQLLKNNPGQAFSHQQVLNYSKEFIRHRMGLHPQRQEPIFHGPKGSLQQTFLWPSGEINSQPETMTNPRLKKNPRLAVSIQGHNKLTQQLRETIENSDFAYLQTPAEVIIQTHTKPVRLYDSIGHEIQSVKPQARSVLDALAARYMVTRLAELENPSTPFALDLWLDEPGKTSFGSQDRVTLYYRVNGLAAGKVAYLTLLNIAPDGKVSILYPKPRDITMGKGQALYVKAALKNGQVYSIPKNRKALRAGQSVGIDLRIRLQAGQEYFKAIVTDTPIDWQQFGLKKFKRRFQAQAARDLVVVMRDKISSQKNWAVASLRVHVKHEQ